MAKKQPSPISVRFEPEQEQRLRALSAEIGVSLLDWIRETMLERADKVEKWIKDGRCYRDARGRLQFVDEISPEERDRLAKLLKGK